MDLSIIIVNWNSADYLKKCLRSIFDNTADLTFEVIVVDNASYDGCDELLKTHYPEVAFVQSDVNLGFAKANNLGFQRSVGENLLFLNPDTEIHGPAIGAMLSYLRTLPSAGAVGCKLVNSDKSIQTTSIQAFPTVLNQTLATDYLIHLFPKSNMWGVKPLFFETGSPEVVEVISGACLMVKRDVFQEVGMFSSDYFMYGEDIDLCYKIHCAGYHAYYVSTVEVVHYGGASCAESKVSEFNAIVKRESVKRFFRKHRGAPTALLFVMSTAIISVVRLSIVMIVIPFALALNKGSRVFEVFVKYWKVLRWSLGMEQWARRLTVGGARR